LKIISPHCAESSRSIIQSFSELGFTLSVTLALSSAAQSHRLILLFLFPMPGDEQREELEREIVELKVEARDLVGEVAF
jgi:hypothetical protein